MQKTDGFKAQAAALHSFLSAVAVLSGGKNTEIAF